ncbi:calcofluor white hypersensitive protein-like protein [Hyaloscypha bicolor E]|uniref:Calcofluor white hypersensitive protein-like protein n=1 Tax=Hyaloscypha bicolor E TaxID=1095630 RepID=A0A2J6TWE6_9HELO|nr:calcofluor white hypersensitive protein-like protein [Hyaloscypha bicolor E]PMD67311.1 calcofluor white hypersensitive protein-like protein [Hyaloscypha bicolor E]
MAPKFKDGDVVFAFSGKWVSWVHTAVAYAAFLGALIVGVALHYHKIVENEYYGYPEEWFPSVSATIGDRYPERSVFMLFIAITSGPRFVLVGLWYLLTARPNATLPKFVAAMGLFRTLTCGGWTYVTSTDDHDWHDIFMISYLVGTLPWTLGCIALSPSSGKAVKYRKYLAGSFFGTLVPLIYFFIQHKVHKVAGAYTTYAFFEWALVLLDVAFDAVTALDFETFELVVKDVKGSSKGNNKIVADAVLEKEKDKQVNQVFGQAFSWSEAIDAVADIYNGFVFWSMLTSLGVLVWYFPLWHMGISGYEVMVMSTVSPLLLGIHSIRSLVVKNLRVCHFLSLAGLLAYQVKSPANRLFTVGFAVWMSCLSWAATWYSHAAQPGRLESKISAWAIGLIASSVVKFAWQTSNPIWPISHASNGGWNATGLLLAVLAVLCSTRKSPGSGSDLAIQGRKEGSSLLAGLGLAGLFFGLHSLLSDSSTMILWVWEGYPVRGPISAPHGAWTIAAMGAGLILGLFNEDIARSWTLFGIGSVGAAMLTLYSNWRGYYGALMLAVYLMAVAVPLIGSAARKSPARTFGIGFLAYNFMVLFHVWVVAYAFVPGGPLVREHTDWVMMTTMLLIGCGVFSSASSTPAAQRKRFNAYLNSRKQRSYYLYVLGVLQLLSVSIAYLRFPTYDYVPYHKDDKILTAGIWTIHFSLDNDMWSSEYRMRDVIKELELDVVGLLESDLQRIIMGNRDTTQFLAEDLGMYVDYGPGPNKHTWGAALLSKFPIVNSTHHLLPSPVGELAPAIEATLDVYGETIDVFVFHSGQEEDPEDRRLQTEYLSKLMGATPRPAILLSYLVTKPLEGNYNTYVSETSGMHDIDPDDWDRWCEYILYKGLKRTGYARVSRSTVTDTEIQVGKFKIGEKESDIAEVRNARINEDQVPEGMRFPQMFRGEGVRGHQYHVFDEPRYYA